CLQEVMQDRWMGTRIRALDTAVADALRPYHRDAVREAWPVMQRAPEPLGARRRHVVLQVWRVLRGVAACERAELRRLRAHRAALGQQVVGSHAVAPQGILYPLVHGDGVLDLVGRADLPMVLHVLAHAGKLVAHRDAVLP